MTRNKKDNVSTDELYMKFNDNNSDGSKGKWSDLATVILFKHDTYLKLLMKRL